MKKFLIVVVASCISVMTYAQSKTTTTTTTSTTTETPAPAPKKVAKVATVNEKANPWEIGISGGLHSIWGDINSNIGFNLDNSTFGVHVRKAFTYLYSMRLQYNYGQASMRSNAPRSTANQNIFTSSGTPAPGFGNDNWFVSSRAYTHTLVLDQVFTIGNSNPNKGLSNWSIDVFGAPALVVYRTKLDARDANGNLHNYSSALTAFNNNMDSRYADGGGKAKNEAGKILDNVFDGTYETAAVMGSQGPIKGYTMAPAVSFGFGINRKLSNKFSASFEQRGFYLFEDYIDGERWANFSSAANPELSQMNDVIWNSTLKLNYFLGSKGATPLYWKNSYDDVNKKLAAMNPRKELNAALADDDADGVPNILDQEPASREGCPVDTKGIMMDSDKDGIIDCDDKEPYSPAGYPVDNNGVAKVPPPACCSEIENMKKAVTTPPSNTPSPACAESALPTVTFEKAKYGINSAVIPALATIGEKMQKCPDMKLVVNGINDKNSTNGKLNEQLSYNRAMEVTNYLSEKFGISRDRFIVRYNLEGVGDQEADRAVMFRNAQEGESGASNPPSPHPGLKAGSK